MKEMADTFDAMLDRLAVSFDAQRRFSGQVAHEIRSPLAVTRTEIEMLLSVPTLYANKIFVATTPSGLQLTFAESRKEPGPMAPRISVLLPFPAVSKLVDLIGHAMKDVEVVEIKGP